MYNNLTYLFCLKYKLNGGCVFCNVFEICSRIIKIFCKTYANQICYLFKMYSKLMRIGVTTCHNCCMHFQHMFEICKEIVGNCETLRIVAKNVRTNPHRNNNIKKLKTHG